jgi:hypothetical protein
MMAVRNSAPSAALARQDGSRAVDKRRLSPLADFSKLLKTSMQDYDVEREHHRQAALNTMRSADPDRAEELIKDYFGAGASTWTGWDEQFITFIEENRKNRLLYGTIGDGWHFLFCATAEQGFWVCAREGMKGKGFLRPQSVAALSQLAREKGLLAR